MAALKERALTAFVRDVFSSHRLISRYCCGDLLHERDAGRNAHRSSAWRRRPAVGRGTGSGLVTCERPWQGHLVENLLEAGDIRSAGWREPTARAAQCRVAIRRICSSDRCARDLGGFADRELFGESRLPRSDRRGCEPIGKADGVSSSAPVSQVLARLDAVRAVADSANRYESNTPWSMRWGLFQGDSVGSAARDAYVRELDGLLLPRFAARLKQRVSESGSQPQKLFLYLKGYLMLGDPRRLDKKHLQRLADLEWKTSSTAPGAGTSLANHFQRFLDESDTLRPIPVDPRLVAQAQGTLRSASIRRLCMHSCNSLAKRRRGSATGSPGTRHREGSAAPERKAPVRAYPQSLHAEGLQRNHRRGNGVPGETVRSGCVGLGKQWLAGELACSHPAAD